MEEREVNQAQTEWRLEATIVRYNVKAIGGWMLFAMGSIMAMLFVSGNHPARAAAAALIAVLGAALISRNRAPLRRVQRVQCGAIRIVRDPGQTGQADSSSG
ncbi:TPA: hypothetical protein QDB23_001704 [Burkholderia vietnamiensis]|nr:hypothetical protein [Burkholderia vietnamiensis]